MTHAREATATATTSASACSPTTASAASSCKVEPSRENAVVMLINRFFCPARSRGTNVDGYGTPVHCQSICWDVLSTVPEVVAVLCSLPDLRIMEATTKACKMWGSSKLHGELLLSLVNSPSRGASLQKCLNDVPASAAIPGFCIKDLQCMEMRTKFGGGFDASITIVRLPPEPQLNKEPAGIVIIVPLSRVHLSGREDAHSMPRDRSGRADAHSMASSVSISPSDSVSCIAEKNEALYAAHQR